MRDTMVGLLLFCSLLAPATVSQATSNGPLEAPLPGFEPPPVIQAPVATPACEAQVGCASYYHPSLDGLKTANGETFSNQLLTAAHRTLEFGTRVRVTNLVNLKSVIVTINDRGPFVRGRIIDLSRRAASALGFVQSGITRVRVEPITLATALSKPSRRRPTMKAGPAAESAVPRPS
jgi:rare lipoprotein A